MKKVNLRDVHREAWISPKGAYAGSSQEVSLALGREPHSTDLLKRHPFDVEICRIPPGKKPWPFHSHSAQWEFYHVLSGKGVVRHDDGFTPIEPGDAFLFRPDEAHQLINDGDDELVVCIIADNPIGESGYYPDSKKWIVRSPVRRVLRSEALDYYDGEE